MMKTENHPNFHVHRTFILVYFALTQKKQAVPVLGVMPILNLNSNQTKVSTLGLLCVTDTDRNH